MQEIIPKIEAVLFVSSRGMTVKEISQACNVSEADVSAGLLYLASIKNVPESGIWLMENNAQYTLSSAPFAEDYIKKFIKDETAGELTKAQLETLTVIAYKGPISRSELDQIRGVNCSIIIRILLLRGLIEEEDGPLEPLHVLSFSAMSHLGITSPKDLPEYDSLRNHSYISGILDESEVTSVEKSTNELQSVDTEEV